MTTQPTATATGVRTYTCTRCGTTKTESIPATGNTGGNTGGNARPQESCNGGSSCPSRSFTDEPVAGNWAHAGVDFAVSNGMMNGMGNNQFKRDTNMTRAQLVTILYRAAGSPKASASNPFADVPAGTWYTEAVLWAAKSGVTTDVSATSFQPNANITREQMATFLCRFAKNQGTNVSGQASLNSVPDAEKVSSWAKPAIQWAVAEGLINGTSKGLEPQGSATRAQIATIMMRYFE